MKLNSLFACLCLLSCISCQHQNTQPDVLQSSSSSVSKLQISEEVIANKNTQAREPLKSKHVTTSKENLFSTIPWYCIISLITFDECTTEKGTRIGKQ
jgi:hypothetical protein